MFLISTLFPPSIETTLDSGLDKSSLEKERILMNGPVGDDP